MFFRDWFKGIERDKKQLYQITGQVFKLQAELNELEDTHTAVSKIFQNDVTDVKTRIKFQQVQVDELYKTIEQITDELRIITSRTALRSEVVCVQEELDHLTSRVTALEKNSQQNDGGGR